MRKEGMRAINGEGGANVGERVWGEKNVPPLPPTTPQFPQVLMHRELTLSLVSGITRARSSKRLREKVRVW